MKKSYLFLAIISATCIGYASASISPIFPNSLPVAVSGGIIKASDMNALVQATQNLEKRSLIYNQSQNRIELPSLSSGLARTTGSEIFFSDTGTLYAGKSIQATSMQANILQLNVYSSVNALPNTVAAGSMAYVQNGGIYYYNGSVWTSL